MNAQPAPSATLEFVCVAPGRAPGLRSGSAYRARGAMDALARRVALSPRQLRTEFTREFGLGPKSAARLARFETALARIAGTVHAGGVPSFSEVAAETGYGDHAHLTREFRQFAGSSPSRWIRQERRILQAGGHGTVQD